MTLHCTNKLSFFYSHERRGVYDLYGGWLARIGHPEPFLSVHSFIPCRGAELCPSLCRAEVAMISMVAGWLESANLTFFSLILFLLLHAEVGMISMVAGWLESAIRAAPEGSRTLVAVQILLWVSAFISALLDNIPYTIVMGGWWCSCCRTL